MNKGDGSFFIIDQYTLGDYDSITLIPVDLNNDNYPDFIAKCEKETDICDIQSIVNKGDSSFLLNEINTLRHRKILTIEDINNDGFHDLIITIVNHDRSSYPGSLNFYIYINRGDGKFSPRDVVLGRTLDHGNQQILAGLLKGETVVTSGQFLLDSESKLKEAVQKMLDAQVRKQVGEESMEGME